MSPEAGLALEIGAAYLMLFSLSGLGKLHGMRPVWVRKLAHAATALLALSYPAVLREGWAVAAMCGLILAHLVVIRTWPPAKRSFGVILGGLEASSWGDLFLPVAVLATFLLARGDKALFAVPVLILALADPVAALVGSHFGRLRYPTFEGTKSIEGSLAFFLVAFVCALAVTRRPCASAALGVLVTLVEVVTWRGIDNLTVPLASWLVLRVSQGLAL